MVAGAGRFDCRSAIQGPRTELAKSTCGGAYQVATVKAIALGANHSCALRNNGGIECWGLNANGQIGLGDNKDAKLNIGDGPNEMGDNLPAINFGSNKTPTGITMGQYHACAIFSDNSIKCWGSNTGGQLGLGDITGNNLNIGDGPDEMGDNLPTVKLFSNAW